MANRNRRSSQRPRRRQDNKRGRKTKRNTPRLPASAIRNNASVSVRAPAIRELCIFAKQFTQTMTDYTGAAKNIWLDSLKLFGLIALKIFLTTLTSTTKTITSASGPSLATTSYITSAVQSILIGAEDVLWSSPIVETEEMKAKNSAIYKVPCIDYQQAKMSSAVIRITSGSAISSRAGRFVACVLDLSEEEIPRYMPANETLPVNRVDSWSFQDVIQLAGAVTAPFGTPITINWRARPTTYAYRFLGIGQTRIEDVDFTTNLRGGRPCFRLIIGYQDFASLDGAASSLYSPDEALVHIDIRGHIQLKESGRRYIRSWPVTTMNDEQVSVISLPSQIKSEVSISKFARDEKGVLHHIEPISMDGMVLE